MVRKCTVIVSMVVWIALWHNGPAKHGLHGPLKLMSNIMDGMDAIGGDLIVIVCMTSGGVKNGEHVGNYVYGGGKLLTFGIYLCNFAPALNTIGNGTICFYLGAFECFLDTTLFEMGIIMITINLCICAAAQLLSSYPKREKLHHDGSQTTNTITITIEKSGNLDFFNCDNMRCNIYNIDEIDFIVILCDFMVFLMVFEYLLNVILIIITIIIIIIIAIKFYQRSAAPQEGKNFKHGSNEPFLSAARAATITATITATIIPSGNLIFTQNNSDCKSVFAIAIQSKDGLQTTNTITLEQNGNLDCFDCFCGYDKCDDIRWNVDKIGENAADLSVILSDIMVILCIVCLGLGIFHYDIILSLIQAVANILTIFMVICIYIFDTYIEILSVLSVLSNVRIQQQLLRERGCQRIEEKSET